MEGAVMCNYFRYSRRSRDSFVGVTIRDGRLNVLLNFQHSPAIPHVPRIICLEIAADTLSLKCRCNRTLGHAIFRKSRNLTRGLSWICHRHLNVNKKKSIQYLKKNICEKNHDRFLKDSISNVQQNCIFFLLKHANFLETKNRNFPKEIKFRN